MSEKNNKELIEYCLRLGDTGLILSQRLAEWCGHGPILEEDIALTNISLDLLGQARTFLIYAAELEGKEKTEDDFAFFRNEREFRNALLAELPNGDYAQTILRQFFISAFQYYLYSELKNSKDQRLSALAEKSLKEVTYHLRHSSEWVLRFGNGTEESHQRILNACTELWRYTGDLFDMDETERKLAANGIAVDLTIIKPLWEKKINEVFLEATIPVPGQTFMITGSRQGKHTEYLGHLLSEMQVLPRSFPGATW